MSTSKQIQMKRKLIYVMLIAAVLYTSALMAMVMGLKESKPNLFIQNHSIIKPIK